MSAQKITISDLPELTGTVEDTYVLPIDDGEVTKKVTVGHFEEAASATARQYAEAAADSATAAAGSAHDAEETAASVASDISAATTAANDARGAATRAAGSASDASIAALQAQRSAGSAATSANSASSSATSATNSESNALSAAARAASWADYPGQTGSGDATHNAHFYADQAAAAITGVASWNGRGGNVVPQYGDYNIDMMGDVSVVNPTDGQMLQYEEDSGAWKNTTLNIPGKMNIDGSNAAEHVRFDSDFTVGSRAGDLGDNSVAEGHDVIASGMYSHAEGDETIATGKGAHAEGHASSALTKSSHAEGDGCVAGYAESNYATANTKMNGAYLSDQYAPFGAVVYDNKLHFIQGKNHYIYDGTLVNNGTLPENSMWPFVFTASSRYDSVVRNGVMYTYITVSSSDPRVDDKIAELSYNGEWDLNTPTYGIDKAIIQIRAVVFNDKRVLVVFHGDSSTSPINYALDVYERVSNQYMYSRKCNLFTYSSYGSFPGDKMSAVVYQNKLYVFDGEGEYVCVNSDYSTETPVSYAGGAACVYDGKVYVFQKDGDNPGETIYTTDFISWTTAYDETGEPYKESVPYSSLMVEYNNDAILSIYSTGTDGYIKTMARTNTYSVGGIAHAEGKDTVAIGEVSHAEGRGTIAGYANQHVQGKYNSNKSDTLFEIGNGTSDSNRSNAFEVYSDGIVSVDNGTTKLDLNTVASNAASAAGTWTSAVSAAVGATSASFSDAAIKTTSVIDVYCDNTSGTPVPIKTTLASTGSATITFDALTEATSFKLWVR